MAETYPRESTPARTVSFTQVTRKLRISIFNPPILIAPETINHPDSDIKIVKGLIGGITQVGLRNFQSARDQFGQSYDALEERVSKLRKTTTTLIKPIEDLAYLNEEIPVFLAGETFIKLSLNELAALAHGANEDYEAFSYSLPISGISILP